MATTPVINLEPQNVLAVPPHPTRDLEMDRVDNANHDKLDAWAGQVSGSFETVFNMSSGSATENLSANIFLGAAYAPTDRVIKEVVCWAHTSGSGGVTQIDVQVGLTNFASIFTNTAFKPALSSSLGNFGLAKSSTFTSGSNTRWIAGTLIRAKLDTAAGAAGLSGQNGVTVCIRWVPSGSFA